MSESCAKKSSRLRFTWKRKLLLGYVVLLAASTMARWLLPSEGTLQPGQQRVEVQAYDRDQPIEARVFMAYQDIPARNGDKDAPVLVLIHGSPIGSRALKDFTMEMNQTCRLIVPDLPGFGGSTIDIADYSTRAGARYTLALMDALGIDRAYMAGYSMGGGVVLNIVAIAPERVEGIIMASSVGVQERELLGNFALNHGLHGMQLAGLWLIQNFVPHFGYMDHAALNVAYARNFYDTDQRPFRSILESYTGPALVIHGEEDVFVPPAAAVDHARLLANAELVWTPGGHLEMLTDPAAFAQPMRAFIDAVKRGSFAPQSLDPKTFPETVREPGYGLLFVLLVLGTQVSEDLTCILAGLLASQGIVPLWAAIVACALGILLGDLLLYGLGYFFGKPALSRAPLKWLVSEQSVNHMDAWFHRRGGILILISRFVPGTRIPTYVGAGVLRMPLRRFIVYFLIAVLAWTPILVGVSYAAGEVVLRWVEHYDDVAIWILLGLIVTMLIVFNQVMPLLTWRGRRLALSRWRRLTRWEYWPLWAIYLPMGTYIIWHGLTQYRRASLFTAVNPGIPNGGGLANESKVHILRGLAGAGDAVAAWVNLPLNAGIEQNLATLDTFMAERGLSFPVVFKPDLGERGEGVAIVHQREDVADYLKRALEDTIVQAYVPGLEYGVFYYRYPGEASGHILGITDKRFPELIGDGENNLEGLILRNERAIGMARFFLKKFDTRLDDVPAKGERIPLAELGTHCRGSLFLDGSHLVTPQLIMAMDRISQPFAGFDFGRYDIRVPSVEDLQAGRNITVLELNGLSSEATFIYDPKYSYWFGLRTLRKQWRICFEIAAINQQNGHQPMSAWQIYALYFRLKVREKLEV